ncbi:MAG: DUF4132 domain-containing protein [Bryobacteraceae bacterium]
MPHNACQLCEVNSSRWGVSPVRSWERYPAAAGSALDSEHALISRWIEEAAQTVASEWRDVELGSVEAGKAIQQKSPAGAAALLRAAMIQLRHWDDRLAELRSSAASGQDPFDVHSHPEWPGIWMPRRHTLSAVKGLLRRALPLDGGDIGTLVEWFAATSSPELGSSIARAVQRYLAENSPGADLERSIHRFAAALRRSYSNKEKSLGTAIKQLLQGAKDEAGDAPVAVGPPPEPAPCGNPKVLYDYKCRLGIQPEDSAVARVVLLPDQFAMLADSPLAEEHAKLSELFGEVIGTRSYSPDLRHFAAGRDILAADRIANARYILAAAERHIFALSNLSTDLENAALWQSHYAACSIAKTLMWLPAEFQRDELFDFLLYLSSQPQQGSPAEADSSLDEIVTAIGTLIQDGADLAPGERFVLYLWRAARILGPPLGTEPPEVVKMTRWIGDRSRFFLVPGEYWTDALNADLAAFPARERSAWVSFLKHALTATSSRPSARWVKTARELVSTIGEKHVSAAFGRWMMEVPKGRAIGKMATYVHDTRGSSDTIHDENATALRGMLWTLPLLSDSAGFLRLISTVAVSTYKKVPGVGPRAVKVGNAAVYALSEIITPESVGFLAMLKVRVRFGTAQKEIEKAFDVAAAALELPRDQIEELGVPACGLETVGRREEILGGCRAELVVDGSEAALRWFDPRGKSIKAVPARVKREHTEAYKDLQQDLKDVAAMLSAQRERVDSLFLSRKCWSAVGWRERYLDHPLVGTIARRLIWCIDGVPAIAIDGHPIDIDGGALTVGDKAQVTLWHPSGRETGEVLAWRRRIESLGIVQPFKQAHREIYLLTDAELRTGTYSNRFAAHILRQHQFNALCGARRWKNKLRLMVDDSYPPSSRELPEWGLRAEFWIEGVGEGYGVDTNEAGVFHMLATDQVRFYRVGAAQNAAHAGGGGYAAQAAGPGDADINEPLPLNQIPALVFSEVMRDVDLFVGVSSIGNDPAWQDGGPGGRYLGYWQDFSFGDLSEAAVTRREVLVNLLPRLKIAARCTLNDRFLEVRGDLRSYKIHLGSGNILMKPNDQYLCIVPDSRAKAGQSPIYLPFEGDGTLSIILSKAFLLAEDGKITDPTIVRQIQTY